MQGIPRATISSQGHSRRPSGRQNGTVHGINTGGTVQHLPAKAKGLNHSSQDRTVNFTNNSRAKDSSAYHVSSLSFQKNSKSLNHSGLTGPAALHQSYHAGTSSHNSSTSHHGNHIIGHHKTALSMNQYDSTKVSTLSKSTNPLHTPKH